MEVLVLVGEWVGDGLVPLHRHRQREQHGAQPGDKDGSLGVRMGAIFLSEDKDHVGIKWAPFSCLRTKITWG